VGTVSRLCVWLWCGRALGGVGVGFGEWLWVPCLWWLVWRRRRAVYEKKYQRTLTSSIYRISEVYFFERYRLFWKYL